MLKMFRKKAADPKETLRAALGDRKLPSFPALVLSALEKVRDPEASMSQVADLVVADPGLSVKVISSVNSPAFALRHKVRSVHHAASLLGRSSLESILITMAVGEVLPGEPLRGYEPSRFWQTAAKRAATARALAARIDPSTGSESFSAALLEDMAVPMLASHKKDEYGALLEHWHNSDDDLARLEQGEFGWNHAEVGGAMCETWNFPEAQAKAIQRHHDAAELVEGEPEEELLPAVRMVAALREVDEQIGIDRLIEQAGTRWNLPADDVNSLVENAFEEAEEIARLFE